MSKSNFSEDFKRDAVRQITERGYPVAEVFQRLGVSQHSLYEWKKKFAASNAKGNDEAEEIRRLKKELARVTEERDILKNDHGLWSACARWKQAVLRWPPEGSCRLLIGGDRSR